MTHCCMRRSVIFSCSILQLFNPDHRTAMSKKKKKNCQNFNCAIYVSHSFF
ncbi:unnamed protein product [Ixodes pacificus]